jgi:hypothetical protein
MNTPAQRQNKGAFLNREEAEMTTETHEPAKARGIREAALRAEEIRNRIRNTGSDDIGDMYDEFYISPTVIPDGWDYNWKRKVVAGYEDKEHTIEMLQAGWEPVDASRHPEMMPAGYKGAIERKGMVLMERPKEISDLAKQRELATAKKAVSDKEQALGLSRSGEFERGRKSVSKSYAPVEIPRS